MTSIELDMAFNPRAAMIRWLSNCGDSFRPQFGFRVQWVDDRTAALQSMFSTEWADANTHATGELTGSLAKADYDTYGTTWNTLAKQSRALLEESIKQHVLDAIHAGGWAEALGRTPLPELTPAVSASIGKQMTDLRFAKAWTQCLFVSILGDTTVASLEITYRRKFPRVPVFFERLLEVYEAGRLPCGWEGDLDDWPIGRLVVH